MSKRRMTAAFALVLMSFGAWAQIDMGIAQVIQNDRPVGMVWIPAAADPCEYVEYWLLGPDYVYPNSPGLGQSTDTVIRPVGDTYEFSGVAEYFRFAREQFPGGKRLIVSTLELETCGSDSAGQ